MLLLGGGGIYGARVCWGFSGHLSQPAHSRLRPPAFLAPAPRRARRPHLKGGALLLRADGGVEGQQAVAAAPEVGAALQPLKDRRYLGHACGEGGGWGVGGLGARAPEGWFLRRRGVVCGCRGVPSGRF